MGVLLQKTEVWTRTFIRRISGRDIPLRRVVLYVIALAALLFLALYNLSDYPLTWFDEGSAPSRTESIGEVWGVCGLQQRGISVLRSRPMA